MKKIIFALILGLVLSFVILNPVLAKENPTPVVIKATEVFNGDTFKAAEDLVFSGKVKGDLFLAGGMVTFDGETTGDLFVAGGKVTIKGKIGQNLRLAGGQITINSTIGQNLLVAGGTVELGENTTVIGSLIALGGSLENQAKINLGGNLFTGRLYQNGQFGKNVNLMADQFLLGPKAKIAGNLIYKAPNELSVEEQKQIVGKAEFTMIEKPPTQTGQTFNQFGSQGKNFFKFFKGVILAFRIVSLISSFVLGIIAIRLLPNFTNKVLSSIEENPLKDLLWGIIYWLALPFFFILVTVSLVGIPLIPLLVMLMGIIHLLAKIFGPMALGHLVFLQLGNQERRGWALLVGLAITFVIGFVPFLGGLFLMILNGVATGTIVNNFYQKMTKSQKCCCQ